MLKFVGWQSKQNAQWSYEHFRWIASLVPWYLEVVRLMKIFKCNRSFKKAFADAYTSRELVYEWQTVNFVPGMTLSQFDLISFPYRNFTFKRREGKKPITTFVLIFLDALYVTLNTWTGLI